MKQPLGYRSPLWELLTTLKNNGQKLLQLETWGAAKCKRKRAAAAADVCTYACINPYQAPLLLAACIKHPWPSSLQFPFGTAWVIHSSTETHSTDSWAPQAVPPKHSSIIYQVQALLHPMWLQPSVVHCLPLNACSNTTKHRTTQKLCS